MRPGISILICVIITNLYGQNFDGLHMNLSNLYRLSDAETRSIFPENFTGEKGNNIKLQPDENLNIIQVF